MCCVKISPSTVIGYVRRDDGREFSGTDPARVGPKVVKAQMKESQTLALSDFAIVDLL